MKKYLLFITLLLPAISHSSSEQLSAEAIAQLSARCYVTHRKLRTDYFKSGDAIVLIKIIDHLVGKSETHRYINNADIQQNPHTYKAVSHSTKSSLKRHCLTLTDKLQRLPKNIKHKT